MPAGDGVREQIDEILWRQSCYPGSVGLSPSEVRDAIEALVAAAETQARIDELEQLKTIQFWAADDAYDAGQVVGVDDIDKRLVQLRAQKEREA